MLALATLSTLAVGACREEEQDRILIQQKGVYQGQSDTPLTEEQLRELRFRGNQQNF
jgi:hypothetical protein